MTRSDLFCSHHRLGYRDGAYVAGQDRQKHHHSKVEAIEITAHLGLLVFPLWMAALIWAYLVPVRLNATLETDGEAHDDGQGTGKAAKSVSMELGRQDMKEGEA